VKSRTTTLIEREAHLEALRKAIAESSASGCVVLVSGEAGFGKTSLLDAAFESLDHQFRVLATACEPIGIPAAFAPLYDLLHELPDDVRHDIRSGAGRPAVNAGLLDLIKNDRIVLVFEDMHWGDEATMGLIRYLGRRIGATNSVLIVTYRSEEVDLTHPLRLVIADLGSSVLRIELPPLTAAGVAQLAEGIDIDPLEVHAATLGNPFFVEELLRHPGPVVPPTIGNAVLASAAQLPDPGIELLQLVALSTDGVALDFLISQAPEAGRCLDLAVQRRLLVAERGHVTCRHDIIRESLIQALTPTRGRDLHLRLLADLEAGQGVPADITKLAFHSIGAGADEKAARYSLEAARQSARVGAHRQAAFHYSNALEFRSLISQETLREASLEAAMEHCLINDFQTASDLAGLRLQWTDSIVEKAKARAWLAFFQSRENDLVACRREAGLATEVLRNEPASEELALALSVTAWVELVEGDCKGAISHGDEAAALARSVGAAAVEVHAATTAGTARFMVGDSGGRAQLERAVALGIAENVGESAARALNSVGVISLRQGRLDEARDCFDRMIEYALAHELDAWYIAGIATRAWINVAAGRWSDADRDLEAVLGQRTCVQTEVESVVAAAMLRARRGDPGSTDLIDQALRRIEGSTDQELLIIGCALAMEGAWIGLVPLAEATSRYAALVRSGALLEDHSGRAMLAFWARRLDLDPPAGRIGPTGLEYSGDVAGATRSWEESGYRLHAAIARAMLPNADLESVVAELNGMGADGTVRGLRRELQRRGVRHIPRGESASTRENPAGLTRRQAEVLALMASGLSNVAIAEALFITPKTASHHVSAVLSKLNASSRLEAVAKATANGWTRPEPVIPN
jgi:DNA-binding CsgD family transcriptional regulator/tetratricopeptide (TPR) repeat protein